MMTKLSVALLVAFTVVVPARADSVDDFVRTQMESKHIPGMAIAVVKDGKPIKVRGYGFADLERKSPVTADSIFRIGSVSKQIIAVAIMQLVNDGKISLDDPAVKFLDGAPEAWNDITVRHLLTHTSGLTREGPGFNPMKMQGDADLIKSAYATPLVFKTGEKWQYSNLGYFVLAEIITKASGKPWPSFIDERIFSRLEMNASGTVDSSPVSPPRAYGYVFRTDRFQQAVRFPALRPSGAFQSSLNDMIKWDAALNDAAILPRESLNTMWTPVTLSDGSAYPYGFGFQVESYGSNKAITHGGSLTGFRSWYLRLPDHGLSVIVLSNNEVAPTDAIAAGIASQYIKDLFPNYSFEPLTDTELDALVGSYSLQGGRRIEIAKKDNGLQLNFAAGFELSMLPNSSHGFFSPDDPRRYFEFERGESYTKLTMFFNGNVNGTAVKD